MTRETDIDIDHPILHTEGWSDIYDADKPKILEIPTVELDSEAWEVLADAIYGHDREAQVERIVWFNVIKDSEREYLAQNRITLKMINEGRVPVDEPWYSTVKRFQGLWNKRLGLKWYDVPEPDPDPKDTIEQSFDQLINVLNDANAALAVLTEDADDLFVEMEASRKRAVYQVMLDQLQAMRDRYTTSFRLKKTYDN